MRRPLHPLALGAVICLSTLATLALVGGSALVAYRCAFDTSWDATESCGLTIFGPGWWFIVAIVWLLGSGALLVAQRASRLLEWSALCMLTCIGLTAATFGLITILPQTAAIIVSLLVVGGGLVVSGAWLLLGGRGGHPLT